MPTNQRYDEDSSSTCPPKLKGVMIRRDLTPKEMRYERRKRRAIQDGAKDIGAEE
jgi:hypothetical protein